MNLLSVFFLSVVIFLTSKNVGAQAINILEPGESIEIDGTSLLCSSECSSLERLRSCTSRKDNSEGTTIAFERRFLKTELVNCDGETIRVHYADFNSEADCFNHL